MNFELKTSVVRGRIQLRPCKMGTEVNVRTCRDNIALTITKTQIDKHYRDWQVAYPEAEQLELPVKVVASQLLREQ